MMPHHSILSARGLSSTLMIGGDLDFTFMVGGHIYATNQFLASFISPLISENIHNDSSFDSFTVDLNDDNCEFNLVFRLCYCEAIDLTPANRKYLSLVGEKLGNRELMDLVKDSLVETSNIDEYMSMLDKYSNVSEDEMNFAAEHFDEIDSYELMTVLPDNMEEILNSPCLKISTEDKLLDFVVDYIDIHPYTKIQLLSCIRSEYLSDTAIQRFISLIDDEEISGALWNSVRRRLLFPFIETFDDNRFIDIGAKVKYQIDQLDGIFKYLEKKHGNLIDNIIVSIIGSNESDNLNAIIGSANTKYGFSASGTEQRFITIDFKSKKVKLKNNTLRTYAAGVNGGHLKSWKILGSNDNEKWTVLDERANDSSINHNRAYKTFECKNPCEFFRYIRIYSDKPTWSGSFYINLTRIELFGNLIE